MCAYQGVRNVNFSENFAYVLNEWSLKELTMDECASVLVLGFTSTVDLSGIHQSRVFKLQWVKMNKYSEISSLTILTDFILYHAQS